MRHGHVVVKNILECTSRTEKIILYNLAKTNVEWSRFAWLEAGHKMDDIIERTLFHLERAGALRAEKTIFKCGTTNLDPCHARRVLRTSLLATQTISMQGGWRARSDCLWKIPLGPLHSFASHVEGVISFLICRCSIKIWM